MAKIRCAHCANESAGRCTVKKAAVHLNKKRNCDKFILEDSKVKEKQDIPTTRAYYNHREDLRREMRKKRRELRELKERGLLDMATMPNVTDEHPLTGDLSRFTTTAPKIEEE